MRNWSYFLLGCICDWFPSALVSYPRKLCFRIWFCL
jgi:hypothetical protein